MKHEELISSAPLSEEERRQVRLLLRRVDRWDWVWVTVHRVILACGAVAAALTAIKIFMLGTSK